MSSEELYHRRRMMNEFRQALTSDPLVRTLYDAWLQGEFVSFEAMLIYLVNSMVLRNRQLLDHAKTALGACDFEMIARQFDQSATWPIDESFEERRSLALHALSSIKTLANDDRFERLIAEVPLIAKQHNLTPTELLFGRQKESP